MDESEEYEVMSCVRGYHIYQLIWDASIGEMLRCKSDSHNSHDRYVISVTKDELLLAIYLENYLGCAVFLRRGGKFLYP